MTDEVTQADLDNLADIIWWIKGYAKGADDNYESCPFKPEHVESLRKARLLGADLVQEKTQVSSVSKYRVFSRSRFADVEKAVTEAKDKMEWLIHYYYGNELDRQDVLALDASLFGIKNVLRDMIWNELIPKAQN